MDRNAIHVFVRVAGFALVAAAVIGMVEGIWLFAVICLVLLLAIVVLEVVTFAKRRHEIHERRG